MIPGFVQRQEMIGRLRRLADHLEDGTAETALRNAKTHHDARGFPTGTLGDGGSRSSDPTSSTERAAIPPRRDATLFHYALMRERSLLADKVIGELLNLIGEWTPNAREELPRKPLATYCSNPRCPFGDVPLARVYGGRHRKCYDFRANHDRDLSIEDLSEDEYRAWAEQLGQSAA